MSLLFNSCWDSRANNQSIILTLSRQSDEPSLFMKGKQNTPRKHIWFRNKSIGLCCLIYLISCIATVIFWNNDFKCWSFTYPSSPCPSSFFFLVQLLFLPSFIFFHLGLGSIWGILRQMVAKVIYSWLLLSHFQWDSARDCTDYYDSDPDVRSY